MASPRSRSLHGYSASGSNGYQPLSDAKKPRPPPKPKTKKQIEKQTSAPSITPTTSEPPPLTSSYFSGGGSGFGYCLPALHKTRKSTKSSDEDEEAAFGSELHSSGEFTTSSMSPARPRFSKPKFGSQEKAPNLSALPEKFRISFEERSKMGSDFQSPSPTSSKRLSSSSTSALFDTPISEETSEVQRRYLTPSSTKNDWRKSNPLPSPSSSLPARIDNDFMYKHSDSSEVSKSSESPVIVRSRSASTRSRSGSLPHTTPSPPVHRKSPTPSSVSRKSPSPSSPSAKQPVTFAQPPPREMEYTEREHPRKAFEYLDKLRTRGDLCDVTLLANSEEIRAHRVVLASCSSYFESMFIGEFSEPDGEPIIIDEMSEDALKAMVDFAYTSRIKLTDRNIYSIFEAADLFQLSGVKSACYKFFKQQINKSNCIRTWLFAESNNCTELMEASLKFIECNYLDIVRGREYLDLEQADVVARLASLEDLAITSEEQVFEAVVAWVHRDLDKRRKHAATVLKAVRLPSMSRDYLMHIVDSEVLIRDDPDLLQMMIDALETHVSTIRATLRRKLIKEGGSGAYSNMMPRPASMAVEVVEIDRANTILGVRIMGGTDRPNHVFRQGDKPGIFVLHLLPEGAAAKCGRLRAGDRILTVNGSDVSNATHEQAVRLLKTSPDPLRLLIRHEHPPRGLKELTLVTKPREGFGFSINGGVNSFSGNPFDETDEGIFISQIIPGGAAEQDGRLNVGMRLLQVNSISLLGKTQDEALHILHGVLDRINLLVCFGYDADAVPLTIDTLDEFGYVGSETLYERVVLESEGGAGGKAKKSGDRITDL